MTLEMGEGMVPTWKLAWHQGYSYRVKSCSLVCVSSIVYKMSQEALNQQGVLLAKDPVVQEVFPPRDVSALTPLHAVPRVWPAEHRHSCIYCLLSCLSLLRLCALQSFRAGHDISSRKSFLPLQCHSEDFC